MSRAAPPLVLILCTGNSCRSQMAEAILRRAAGEMLRVQSAGSRPAGFVHPMAIEVLGEIGLSLPEARSKSAGEFPGESVETVITVCSDADRDCPAFPGRVIRHHWGFDDPALATGSDDERRAVFRRVRDEIVRVFGAYADGRRDQAASPLPGSP